MDETDLPIMQSDFLPSPDKLFLWRTALAIQAGPLSQARAMTRHALRAGLVSEVTQPEFTVERALAIARLIAQKAPLAVRLAKEAVLKAEDTDLASGLRFERHAFTLLAGTRDRDEGIRAFQEKRRPDFTGQ